MKKSIKYIIFFSLILVLLYGINFAVKNKIITFDFSYFKNYSNKEITNNNDNSLKDNNKEEVSNASSIKKEESKPSSSSKKTVSKPSSSSKKTSSKPSSSSSKKTESKPSSSKPIKKATIDLYYRPACQYCSSLLDFLNSLDSKTKSKFVLIKHNIEDAGVYDKFMDISMKIDGESAKGVPYAVFNGKEAINGFNEEYERLYLSYIYKYSD